MIKHAIAPVAILVLSFASYFGTFSTDPNVVLLKAITKVRGSGVVVADGWILTVAHVLPVTSAGGMACGRVVIHPSLDLALVRCPNAKAHGLRLAWRKPGLYDRLYAYGWHRGRLLLKTEGYQGYPFDTLSAAVIHGVSGGAVVNDRRELVGVLRGVGYMGTTPTDRHQHGYALPHMAWYTPIDVDWILQHIEKRKV